MNCIIIAVKYTFYKNKVMKNCIKFSLLSLVFVLASCKNEDPVDKELKDAAASMNKMTPQDLSDGIRLDSVSAGHLSLRYNYTLTEDVKENVTAEDIRVFKEDAREAAKSSLKASEDMADLKGHKIKFDYIYYDKNGKKTADFSVLPEDYK